MNKEEYKGIKSIEDYKSYYEDSTREQIIEDTYIDFVGYKNLARKYAELKQENQQLKETIEKAKNEISTLMSRYFYEEDFYIEDTDLDRLLQILDKGDSNE